MLILSTWSAKADKFLQVSQFDPSYAPSTTASGNSSAAVFTPDGRYVAFASTAENLALASNHTTFAAQFWPSFNVYLRDRTQGTTTLVSINATGTGGANADAMPKGISTNGQFVLFESSAGNLVTNVTTGQGDIYLRDVINGQTLLVSANTNRAGANAVSQDSVLTPDGRFVAFSSHASDLVPKDTNGIFDVFIRDTVGATTELVSVGATQSPNFGFASESKIPSVTPDGRYVVFFSTATNLVPGVPAVGDLFMRDTLSNTTAWVSAGAQGLFQSFSPFSSNSLSFNAALSDDGNYVAYQACSVAHPSPPYGFILRFNRRTGLTDIVDTNAYVRPVLFCENEGNLDMTPDGRFIAFVGNAGSAGSTNSIDFTNAVFLWDAESRSNTLVSINLANGVSPGAESDLPSVSTNGQYVTFVSSDSNLTTNILNGPYHLYRRDMLAGVTQLVDTDTNSAGAGITPDTAAVMSADGDLVAYQSDNASIVTNDRNRDFDLFISDFTRRGHATGAHGRQRHGRGNHARQQTELISARDPALPSLTPDGLSGISVFSVNSNGRYVAFASEADDLTTNDTNGVSDVFVRDLLNATNTRVSIATNGFSANGASFEPSITGDGRYVAFSSYASNLVADDTNASEDVFVRDLQAGTTTLVSVGQDGVSIGSSNSWQPTISADGRFVLFHSFAPNLASGTVTNLENIFLRDLHSNITYALAAVPYSPNPYAAAMTSDGRYVALAGRRNNINTGVFVWNTRTASVIYTNNLTSSSSVSISQNGQKIAWWNWALTVADLSSRTSRTVATANAGLNFGLNGGIQFSADGNLLAYAVRPASFLSYAYSVYLFNFQTGSNTLISHQYNSTNSAGGSSDSPAISPDGRFIVYRSSGTNLVAGVTNGQANLFVFDASTGLNSLLTQNNLQTAPADSRSLKPVFSGDARSVVFQSWSSDLTSFGDFNVNADLFDYAFPYLQIAPPLSALAGPVLTWPAVPGQSYDVQYVDDLSGSPWQNLSGTLVITGNQASLSDTPPVSSQRFYRLVIQQ